MSENGTDYIQDQLYSYQDANEDKNHSRQADPVGNMTDLQPGMIVSDSDDDRAYHITGASGDGYLELVQRLGVFSAALTDPPTEAEIIALVGTAAAVGDGGSRLIQDANSPFKKYLVTSNGTLFYYVLMTEAV